MPVLELLAIVAPVYLCAGLGWTWARSGRPFDTAFVTQLISDVGAPCLVFSSLTSQAAQPGEVMTMVGATVLALAAFTAVGGLALRLWGLPRTTFLAPLVFGNAGNMGLPVCLFAFGQEGLGLAVGYFATAAILHFTAGQWLWTGRASLATLLRTPLAWSAVASAAVLGTGWSVPDWLAEALRILGGLTIPLMQITLGVSLARIRPRAVRRSLALSALRIGMGAALGLALASLLGFEGVMRGVFVLECSMPVAVFNYMLAEQHRRDPGEVAGLVVISTLMSFATVPLVLALVR